MIKVVTTLKKKDGMSTEEFRRYYEDHHRIIGEKYLRGYAVRYLRRYLSSMASPNDEPINQEFDVLLETWFPDEASLTAFANLMNETDVAKEIEDDEEKLFDRNKKVTYIIEEFESEIA